MRFFGSVCVRRLDMLRLAASDFNSWAAKKKRVKEQKNPKNKQAPSWMSGAVHTHMHTHAQHRNVPEAIWSRNKQAAHRATLISAAAVPFKQGQS